MSSTAPVILFVTGGRRVFGCLPRGKERVISVSDFVNVSQYTSQGWTKGIQPPTLRGIIYLSRVLFLIFVSVEESSRSNVRRSLFSSTLEEGIGNDVYTLFGLDDLADLYGSRTLPLLSLRHPSFSDIWIFRNFRVEWSIRPSSFSGSREPLNLIPTGDAHFDTL